MPITKQAFEHFFSDWFLPSLPEYAAFDKAFCSAATKQSDVQAFLDTLTCGGARLDSVLAALFAWELQADYWQSGLFDANLLLKFPAEENYAPVEFRTQINYSRLRYVAPPTSNKNIKKVCPICFEDNVASDAKPLLRAYGFTLGKEVPTPYFAQATPFPLVRGHFIIIQEEHSPMRIDRRSIDELLDFIDRCPSFTACSNSDVVNAGVSIIGHHHYQVFSRRLFLPVMGAQNSPDTQRTIGGGRVSAAALDYPLMTIRLKAATADRKALLDAADGIITRWKALAPGMNTCNLTAWLVNHDVMYELYLFLRNPNHLTPDDLLRIKSEGVGVIEAAGEGIYPPPATDAGLTEIKQHGREILIRILEGLNPVAHGQRRAMFSSLTESL